MLSKSSIEWDARQKLCEIIYFDNNPSQKYWYDRKSRQKERVSGGDRRFVQYSNNISEGKAEQNHLSRIWSSNLYRWLYSTYHQRRLNGGCLICYLHLTDNAGTELLRLTVLSSPHSRSRQRCKAGRCRRLPSHSMWSESVCSLIGKRVSNWDCTKEGSDNLVR